jgi:hypothetical protein
MCQAPLDRKSTLTGLSSRLSTSYPLRGQISGIHRCDQLVLWRNNRADGQLGWVWLRVDPVAQSDGVGFSQRRVMPYDVLLNGVTWEWNSEYMAAIGTRYRAECGFLVPLSALRFYVMGEARRACANSDEIQCMVQLFVTMQAGPIGFS